MHACGDCYDIVKNIYNQIKYGKWHQRKKTKYLLFSKKVN